MIAIITMIVASISFMITSVIIIIIIDMNIIISNSMLIIVIVWCIIRPAPGGEEAPLPEVELEGRERSGHLRGLHEAPQGAKP